MSKTELTTSKYICLRGGKYLVRNDYNAFSIFYNYFLDTPHVKSTMIKKLFTILRSLFLKIIKMYFTLRLNRYIKCVCNNSNYLICRKGTGNYSNIIFLCEENHNLYILKKNSSFDFFKRELKFLDFYYLDMQNLDLQIPRYSIESYEKMILRYDFLQKASFISEIRNGNLDIIDSLNIYIKICNQLKHLYKDKFAYVHGDLTPTNVILGEEKIFLIDYTDSEYLPTFYDYLCLLYSILIEYEEINLNEFFPYLESDGYLSSILCEVLDGPLNTDMKTEFLKLYSEKKSLKHGNSNTVIQTR
ncbi:hypothetical protein FTO70_14670 [Methanosarcina sp. KYL-1]|uniref:RIO1 family regulatory kinase/ATPase domain-containing protein n=1 Tax=Methanosarcina sp. KYL-1 TaxID=2602068 RepID=UPI002100A78E|nr:RIO1 family regulatory kinase/ATPase [Methanosarcina sp. KYL-1]MCQ1536892.1 hypothetical protein [Methanosarcina sp. KYL-1]